MAGKSSDKKMELVQKTTEGLMQCMGVLNDISNGVSEIQACKNHDVDLTNFRRLYQTKLGGFEVTYQPPELNEDEPWSFWDIDHALLSWQEVLWLFVSGDMNVYHIPPDVEESVDYVLKDTNILYDRELAVLFYRFRERLTLEQVGKIYGVTRDRVRQIESKALRKLRNPRAYRIMKFGIGWYNKFKEAKNNGYESRYREDIEKMENEYFSIIKDRDREHAVVLYHKVKDYVENNFAVDLLEQTRGTDTYYPLSEKIDCLELSVRSYNCLKRADIQTLEDLMKWPVDEMYKIRNLGRKSTEEVVSKMKGIGYEMFPTREDLDAYYEKEGNSHDAV